MALVVSPLTAADVSYQVLFIEVAQTLSRYQPNVAVTRPRLQQTFSYQCIYASMSPRWSSGNPRMLLLIALVLEFESRRAETLNLFRKKKKIINCLERLAWVSTIRRESAGEERAEIFSR